MSISPLQPRPVFDSNPKVAKSAINLSNLIIAIEKKKIPDPQTHAINEMIAGVNDFKGPDQELKKSIDTARSAILKLLEKDLKIVPPAYYQTLWMSIGMAAFGLPLGVAFGAAIGNMAFLGIGIPIGMSIGLALGAGMDSKAKNEGRQLDYKAI
ncbi:hypothetical protein ACFOSV_03595 [Algoriphagus namhaensis]|uniref:Glycine zipper family protein n=1 Tax=Algoriphagus namhaensis TaxID=915353 RepID=A0ABV8AQQ8_9BACT